MRTADGLAVPVIDQGGGVGGGVGKAHGTFGELLQGQLPDSEKDFLVTLPIARWSTASFLPTPDSDEIRVLPAHKHKSRRLVGEILRAYGYRGGGVLTVSSTLPEGKDRKSVV